MNFRAYSFVEKINRPTVITNSLICLTDSVYYCLKHSFENYNYFIPILVLVLFYLELFNILGWLEPLLGRIAQNRTHVVTPNIDNIDASSLAYTPAGHSSVWVGGFDWGLWFTWHTLPDNQNKLRRSPSDPARSVVISSD